ncbi:PD-(D/E)XK nuclease superfamily protein [anaerobic digester metagenome]
MSESLFDYLKAYTPTDKRESREDYLTQMFAWLLNNVNHLAYKYCFELLSQLPQQIQSNYSLYQSDSFSVQTQVTVSNGRIDLVINNDIIGFICEHKVNALLSTDQISKYLLCQSELGNQKYYTVLVALGQFQNTQQDTTDIMLTWSQIYEFLELWSNDYPVDSIDHFMIGQMMAYMKNNNLGKFEAIKPEAISGYWFTYKLKDDVNNMLKNIRTRSWRTDCPELENIKSTGYEEPVFFKERWGRTGLEFFRNWNPGIFAGVLWDKEDHLIEPLNEFEGPDIIVIIDLPAEEYPQVVNSQQTTDYFKLITEQNEKMQYHFDILTYPVLQNNWRFIVARKSLASVLKGTTSADEQMNTLYQTIKDGINLVTFDDHLAKLPW